MVNIKTTRPCAFVNKNKRRHYLLLFTNSLIPTFMMTEVASVSVAPFAPVNFAFDDLKVKMSQFTIRFDKWTQNQRARVLKDRNEFAKAITESRGNSLVLSAPLTPSRRPERPEQTNRSS